MSENFKFVRTIYYGPCVHFLYFSDSFSRHLKKLNYCLDFLRADIRTFISPAFSFYKNTKAGGNSIRILAVVVSQYWSCVSFLFYLCYVFIFSFYGEHIFLKLEKLFLKIKYVGNLIKIR